MSFEYRFCQTGREQVRYNVATIKVRYCGVDQSNELTTAKISASSAGETRNVYPPQMDVSQIDRDRPSMKSFQNSSQSCEIPKSDSWRIPFTLVRKRLAVVHYSVKGGVT
jgi:hypothetical protein